MYIHSVYIIRYIFGRPLSSSVKKMPSAPSRSGLAIAGEFESGNADSREKKICKKNKIK